MTKSIVKPQWQIKAEQEAEAAAQRTRKEVLDRAQRQAEQQEAYQKSLRNYDQLQFAQPKLLDKISKCKETVAKLDEKLSEEWGKIRTLTNELRANCQHLEVVEHQSSYKDEYDSWCDGNWERKCVECLLLEESVYHPSDRYYDTINGKQKKFVKLEKSKVVVLYRVVDGKEVKMKFEEL